MLNLNLQQRLQRFTARTRVYALAIIGVAVGGVYLSLALFFELADRAGTVPAAALTGVVVIFIGAIPWLLMSLRKAPDPIGRPGDPGQSQQPPMVRAEQMGEQAGRRVHEAWQRNPMAGVGIALALGVVAGYSPRARHAVRSVVDAALRAQDERLR